MKFRKEPLKNTCHWRVIPYPAATDLAALFQLDRIVATTDPLVADLARLS